MRLFTPRRVCARPARTFRPGFVEALEGRIAPAAAVGALFGFRDEAQPYETAVMREVGLAPIKVVTADLTGDGVLDIVALNAGGNSFTVLQGTMDGTFTNYVTVATGQRGANDLVVADFTGEGRLDVAVNHTTARNVTVFQNNGEAAPDPFTALATLAVPTGGQKLAAADFNGDGREDLVVSSRAGNGASVFLAGVVAPFGEAEILTATQAVDVAAADFNGDGFADLVVLSGNGGLHFYQGLNTGQFDPVITSTVGTRTSALSVGDFNGDDRADVVVNHQGRQATVHLGDLEPFSAAPEVLVVPGASGTFVSAGDFNGDGVDDVALAAGNGGALKLHFGRGDGTFFHGATDARVLPGRGLTSVAVADFNNDGVVEIVAANGAGSKIGVAALANSPVASFSYTDVDGDVVTVTSTKGNNNQLASVANVEDGPLRLNLYENTIFRGASIRITAVTPEGGMGDGVVNVRGIDATGMDLTSVLVEGDLGFVTAGDAAVSTPALRRLDVGSLSVASAGQVSQLNGSLLALEIRGDMMGSLVLNGRNAVSLQQGYIGGSLIGSGLANSGSIFASGGLGELRIEGEILGGTGNGSGSIFVERSIANLWVGESVEGAEGANSGRVNAKQSIMKMFVGGNVRGFSGLPTIDNNGSVSATNIFDITVMGGLFGGHAATSGAIVAAKTIYKAQVAALVGGAGETSGSIGAGLVLDVKVAGVVGEGVILGGLGHKSGSVIANTKLERVEVWGDIYGYLGLLGDPSEASNSGNIIAEKMLGTVIVHGSLTGGTGVQSGAIGSLGSVGYVRVEGDVAGSVGESSGQIVSKTTLGDVVVWGRLLGGDGDESGTIGTFGKVNSVTVGTEMTPASTATMQGGEGAFSGAILIGATVKTIHVYGGLQGADGEGSGSIRVFTVNTLNVTGTLQGNDGAASGAIFAEISAGAITVGGLVGYDDSTLASYSGSISANGAIGTVTVTGDVVGGEAFYSGSISSGVSIGKVTVGGDVMGGIGSYSGSIGTGFVASSPTDSPATKLGEVWLKGTVYGGEGAFSGTIFSSGAIGAVTLAPAAEVIFQTPGNLVYNLDDGSMSGGLGAFSGSVVAASTLGKVTIYGSLFGGGGNDSGKILGAAKLDAVHIYAHLMGGKTDYDFYAFDGQIASNGTIGSVVIGGTVMAETGSFASSIVGRNVNSVQVGFGSSAGGTAVDSPVSSPLPVVPAAGGIFSNTGYRSSAIVAYESIGAVKVYGAMRAAGSDLVIAAGRNIGSVSAASSLGMNGGAEVVISAFGMLRPGNVAAATAIGKVTMTNNMAFTNILAGRDYVRPDFISELNPDAGIGSVVVGTPFVPAPQQIIPSIWYGNNVIAGVYDGGDGVYGNGNESQQGERGSAVISRIGEIIIHGALNSDSSGAAQHFAVMAQHVVKVTTMNPSPVVLTNGAGNDGPLQLGSPFSYTVVDEKIVVDSSQI